MEVSAYIKGDVLDLGCGTAEILDYINIDNYTGLDYSPEMVKKLKKKLPQHKFFTRNLDEDTYCLKTKYDTITMIAVIEHLFNQRHLFKEIIKHLKPNGRIVLTTPTPFGNDIIHRLGANMGLFSKHASDDHIVIYNKQRFKNVAREFNLKLIVYKKFQLGCNQLVVFKKK
ncbi:MAG: class I SAM-dependent methyltransferase [Candidatus Cloacimonetes bacterium]|nr:class I SAM-dependent methyltransferase [Candidatus Cloacimonadota bacterium]